MENEIITYLSKYIKLSEDEAEVILELNLLRTYKKETILLKEGEIANECYLVLSGCIRSYYLVDGEEKTTGFYTENQPVTPVSYIKRDSSGYYLACVEDCLVCIGTAETTNILLKKVPKIEALSRFIISELLATHQVLFDNYMNMPPEKRYLKLLETRPDLCNRVPQYQLASYLGVKPESLSRIRKRIRNEKM